MANLGERGGRNKDSQPQQRKGPEGTRMGRGRDRSRDGTGVTQNCSKKTQTGPEGAEEKGRTKQRGRGGVGGRNPDSQPREEAVVTGIAYQVGAWGAVS